jgi:23S rRNA pseudouridine2605 synthase
MSERLQKVLAMAGLGSRRKMEESINQGEVQVNGAVASLGQKVDEKDKISFRGKRIKNPLSRNNRVRVIVYHKPVGEICSKVCPEGRPTVYDSIAKVQKGRWVMVGRLDINTSGLLLFTNYGELANRLMHPRYEIDREYAVRVIGEVSPEIRNRLLKGVELDDGPAKFDSLYDAGGKGANHWYHVTLKEGRNREVRRLWESQNCSVSRLIRVRYGQIELPKFVGRGKSHELPSEEVRHLCRLVELDSKF